MSIEFKAGYRLFRWTDATRQRPVWTDVWYPSEIVAEEEPISYSLGCGSVAHNAPLATRDAPFPLVVVSHGASGSASDYAWLSEYLARRGFIVVGVSHYGESWRYGPESVDPTAVTRLWTRPRDCSFALDRILVEEAFAGLVDVERITALGHSSGGATAIALGGAVFDPLALSVYCRSDTAHGDRGCWYADDPADLPAAPPEANGSFRDPRIGAIVLLDPAAGPGYSRRSLRDVTVPALVIGCTDNDFLPFEHHAGHYAAHLPNVSLVTLDAGEGHFVFLNACTSELAANGVPLCVDRPGVDRNDVHARVAASVHGFLDGAPIARRARQAAPYSSGASVS
jgi:predicted dienelactone hydrolase